MIRAFAFALAAAAAWACFYISGGFPWLGFAWLTRSSTSAGPVTIAGETRAGTDFGLETFVFFEGQEIVIEYEAEIRAGSLWFYVYRPFDGGLGDGTGHYVTESGKGTWTLPITETGVYQVTIDTSPTKGKGRGWDMTYYVRWGARPAAGR